MVKLFSLFSVCSADTVISINPGKLPFRILSNKKYLGTDYYPQIIDEETIERFQEELTRRAGNLGRLDRKCKERNITIPTSFRFKPAELTFAAPFEQAEYIYSLIDSEE